VINLIAHAGSPLAAFTGGIHPMAMRNLPVADQPAESTRSSHPRPVIGLLPGLNRDNVIGSLPGFSSWLQPATQPPPATPPSLCVTVSTAETQTQEALQQLDLFGVHHALDKRMLVLDRRCATHG
jgi:hypothetical protein